MKSFELWLDESGQFKNDPNQPSSLVGGLLVPIEKVETVISIILERFGDFLKPDYHSNQDSLFGERALKILECLEEYGVRFVWLENNMRIQIINSDLTYLQVISEGLTKLFQVISEEVGAMSIHVMAANRVKQYPETQDDFLHNRTEYQERINEHLIFNEKMHVGLARRNLVPQKQHWEWKFTLIPARRDYRSLLADIVCHAKFTGKRKFNSVDYIKFEEIVGRNLLFTVFEHITLTSAKQLLRDGAVGEAIFEWLLYLKEQPTNLRMENQSFLEAAILALHRLPSFSQKIQLMILSQYIQNVLDIEHNMQLSEYILQFIVGNVIPIMEQQHIEWKSTFIFNTHLQLLILATHKGNIELGSAQICLLHRLLPQLSERWESLDYIFEFMIREAVHACNAYDLDGAIEKMNTLISILDNAFELLPLIDGLSFIRESIKSDLKGKAYGTLLQARMLLIRQDKEHVVVARRDWEAAIGQFSSLADRSRQYQYRSQIECEAGHDQEALGWLAQSYGLNPSATTPAATLERIVESGGIRLLFGAMHYARLLAASWHRKPALASDMYRAWNKSGIDKHIIAFRDFGHPVQIIVWKLASYHAQCGNQTAAMNGYKQAVSLCYQNDLNWTLHSIGLGILAEQTAYSAIWKKKVFQSLARTLLQRLNDLLSKNLPDAMRAKFTNWPEQIRVSMGLDPAIQFKIYYAMSQEVTY